MIVKLLIGAMVLIALVRMIAPRRPAKGRAAGRVGRRKAPPAGDGIAGDTGREPPAARRVPRADDLEKCAGCGIWLPRGQACDCNARA